MILVLDNRDSFVHNVARHLRVAGGPQVEVVRSDGIDPTTIRELAPSHLVVSPGPGVPADAGVSLEAVRALRGRAAILGVCLGHQVVAAAFGGRVARGERPLHGRASPVRHQGSGILAGLPDPFRAGRYHSLVVEEASLPSELEVVARSDEGEVMALRHRELPVWGVQFHPESVLTPGGSRIFRAFLELGGGDRGAPGKPSPGDRGTLGHPDAPRTSAHPDAPTAGGESQPPRPARIGEPR